MSGLLSLAKFAHLIRDVGARTREHAWAEKMGEYNGGSVNLVYRVYTYNIIKIGNRYKLPIFG
jgi:hypothetical protein